jgi:hypothetical protein
MIENKDKTPVAQNVVTMCTKCKIQLDHLVVSHNMEGIIEKVKCQTCGSVHKYRPEKKKSSKKGVRAKKTDPARDFGLLTEKFKGKEPVRYSMSGSFKADDVIDHNTFGMGIVISTSYKQMDVVFSDRPRILVCNR